MKNLTDQEIKNIEKEDWTNRPYRSKKEAMNYYKNLYPHLNQFVIETCVDYEFSILDDAGINTDKPLSKKDKKILELRNTKK